MVGGTLNSNCHTYCLQSCSLSHIFTFCIFPKGPDMQFGFQQHDNVNPNSLIKKNAKEKKLLCFFPWPSLSACTFLMSGFTSQVHQMPNTIWSFKKIMGYGLKVVGETFERGCVFPTSFNILAIRKRKGRFSVSVSSGRTALSTHLVPKGCSNTALLVVAPGNSPSTQSSQSGDFSVAGGK